jgi:hypothetical protein
MASKNTETRNEEQKLKDQKRVQAYLEDIKELDKKHGLCLVPIIRYGKDAIMPGIEVQSFEVIEPQKADEQTK